MPAATVTTYARRPPTAAPIFGPPTIILIPEKPLAADAASAAVAPDSSLFNVSTIAPSLGVHFPYPPDRTAKFFSFDSMKVDWNMFSAHD